MQEYIERLRAQGELLVVEREVDPRFELAAVTEKVQKTINQPLLFERVAGTRFPVVTNLAAQPYNDPAEIPEVLEQQLRSPVRWADCVQTLGSLGCDVFVEVGPKRALTGMMRELAPAASALSVAGSSAAAELALPA